MLLRLFSSRGIRGVAEYSPLLLILAVAYFRDFSPNVYYQLLREDGVVEVLQALLVFAAAILFFRFGSLTEGYSRRAAFLIGISCLILVGEEISWGQRIFGFKAPELIREHNLQSEMNFHNLTGMKVLTRIVTALAALYGLLVPYFLGRSGELSILLAPSKRLRHYFWTILAFLYYSYFIVNAAKDCRGNALKGRGECLVTWNEQEWMELFVSGALFLHAFNCFCLLRMSRLRNRCTEVPASD